MVASLKKLATELAQIELKLEQMEAKKLLKRSDELKKAILSLAPPCDDAMELVIQGAAGYQVVFTAVPMVQTVEDKERLHDLLGNHRFEELAKFSIKDIAQYLPQELIDSVTELVPSTRHFKEVRRTI